MIAKQLTQPKQTRQFVQTFSGLNRRLRAAEGEFLDMSGLCADEYPVLTTAEPVEAELTTQITGMCGGDRLCLTKPYGEYTDALFLAGQRVEGLELEHTQARKQLVRMGAYLLIWPDKVWVNVETLEHGKMEATAATVLSETTTMSVTMCREDGTEYKDTELKYSATEPENPTNGLIWVDTSGDTVEAKRYSVSLKLWVSMGTTYVKLSGINTAGLKDLDGVTISNGPISTSGSVLAGDLRVIFDANGDHVLQHVGENYVVLIGILNHSSTFSGTVGGGAFKIERTMPDMDYVVECENRIWGCKYGAVDGKVLNEIYACALGDFKNWKQFQGLSTDSYTASRGIPGKWIGAAVYNGSPIFMKENVLERVYISATGAHQITTVSARGGYHSSFAVVGGVLYYKSAYDVCAYDGTEPVSVSAGLGDWNTASPYAAGSYKGKYYLCLAMGGASVEDPVQYRVLSYDPGSGSWCVEGTYPDPVRDFATVTPQTLYWDAGAKLYHYDTTTGAIADWSAETGVIGCATPDNKYISRLRLRLHLAKGGSCNVFVQYDSCGAWEHKMCIPGKGVVESVTLAILPRRCDHFRLKLSGSGLFRLYSMAKIQEEGSDVR